MELLNTSVWTGKIFNGDWVAGGGENIDVHEPATGEVLTTVGMGSVGDVLRASKEAAEAQKAWAKTKPEERAAILRKAGDLWYKYADEVTHWVIRETGAIPPKAGLEQHMAAEICFTASGLPGHAMGSVLPSNEEHWSFARRMPAGVVSIISPFNFPLILSIRSVAPALALGNAVILKPDPRTVVSGGYAIARVFEEAGLPKGLLHVIPGGADIGQAVVTAPEVRIISFTGSTQAGRHVGELASKHLKRVHLELGGNNALIVLPGADIQKAASAAAFGAFLHQGQICMATGRVIVHESLHDEFVKVLGEKASHLPVGNPATEQVALGPIIDEKQLKRIDGIIQESVAEGATLVAGGTYEGLFYRPTVLANVTKEMAAYSQEVFGPVAPVIKFSTIDEAIEIASDNEYGLSLAILGEVGLAMKIADSVPSGIIHINEQTVADEANIPFGGVGASGNGSRFGGEANIEAFTETQWLTVRAEIAPYPF
ncbi:benzaldehyde dehydrogenase [Rhodoluna sp.]|uniref:benzaldehyde dehydrogenase n=1 Tax=Rhodoluna sp. TaxID=1969481 RepID=UPI0025E498D4|nr:benzaldehyde dehydrogenase [Rhodoluna sp.]